MTFRSVPVAPAPKTLGTGLPKSLEEVVSILNERAAGAVKSLVSGHKGDPYILLEADKLVEAMKVLRDDDRLLCIHLLCITATDFLGQPGKPATETTPAVPEQPARIEVIYHLSSFVHRHQLAFKVVLDRSSPKVATLSDLFRAANWYERECYEMLGVHFTNHPYLENLLLPNDWVGNPLRKDYVFPEEYNGMKVPL